jgi:hypothetical protein
MAASRYALQMTDRSPGAPGESDELSLLVLHDGNPVGAVILEWHGDLELNLTSSKFFGGKSPGIENAWQLANLVCRAIEVESPGGISEADDGFLGPDGTTLSWEITLHGERA